MANKITILANGSDFTGALLPFLSKVTITDNMGVVNDTLNLTLQDRHSQLAPPPQWGELEFIYDGVSLGTYELNEYTYDDNTGNTSIIAGGRDTSSNFKSKRTRTIEKTTLGSVLSSIAGEHGYQNAIDTNLSTIQLAHINQDQESDLNLLQRLSTENGAILKPTERTLVITTKDGTDTSGSELPTFELPKKASCSIRCVTHTTYNQIRAKYFDEDTNSMKFVVAGQGSPSADMPTQYKTKEEAQRAAEARLLEYKNASSTVTVNSPLWIEPFGGSQIKIDGRRDDINGAWIAEKITHTIYKGGLNSTKLSLIQAPK